MADWKVDRTAGSNPRAHVGTRLSGLGFASFHPTVGNEEKVEGGKSEHKVRVQGDGKPPTHFLVGGTSKMNRFGYAHKIHIAISGNGE